MAELGKLIARLIEHGVEFVVVGGYAATTHGASYVTFDLDICAPCSAADTANLARLHAALADLHPCHRMSMVERTFVFPPRNSEETGNIYLKTDLGQLDVLGSIELGDYAFARAHSIPVRYASGEYRLLDCPTLIRSKQTTGRPKDLLVAQQLLAILEATQPPPR
jgi:hypothetical protein